MVVTVQFYGASIHMFETDDISIFHPFQFVRVLNIVLATFSDSPQVIVISIAIQSNLLLCTFVSVQCKYASIQPHLRSLPVSYLEG